MVFLHLRYLLHDLIWTYPQFQFSFLETRFTKARICKRLGSPGIDSQESMWRFWRAGPPGDIGSRNRFLGIDSWAPKKFKNSERKKFWIRTVRKGAVRTVCSCQSPLLLSRLSLRGFQHGPILLAIMAWFYPQHRNDAEEEGFLFFLTVYSSVVLAG